MSGHSTPVKESWTSTTRTGEGRACLRSGDMQSLLTLGAEDIEWIIPGDGWPLAGTRRGHDGLKERIQKGSETMETSFMETREFVAQADRAPVIGFAKGKLRPRRERGRIIGSALSQFDTAS
jgi:ketosteroid isomerase-like protein